MKVCLKMTNLMAKVNTNGKMGKYILAAGIKDCSMVKGKLSLKIKKPLECGTTERK